MGTIKKILAINIALLNLQYILLGQVNLIALKEAACNQQLKMPWRNYPPMGN